MGRRERGVTDSRVGSRRVTHSLLNFNATRLVQRWALPGLLFVDGIVFRQFSSISSCRLARWVNAPQTGLDLVKDNILVNHRGRITGRWHLTIRSYRSSLAQIPGLHIPSERTMCALTMEENVFVLLEDPLAPTRGDILEPPSSPAPQGHHSHPHSSSHVPSHYRTTFLTLKPHGALEQLLAQLRARWIPVRQSGSTNARGHAAQGQHILVDGLSFAIGNDWVVRIGNVVLAGNSVKGMLLEVNPLFIR